MSSMTEVDFLKYLINSCEIGRDIGSDIGAIWLENLCRERLSQIGEERDDVNTKILTISDCQDCAHFSLRNPYWFEMCEKLNRKIEQDSDTGTYPIPDDCPLDDVVSGTPASLDRHCCHLSCQREAVWEICSTDESATPDDWTDSCTEHVGALLWDHKAYSVRLIGQTSQEVNA